METEGCAMFQFGCGTEGKTGLKGSRHDPNKIMLETL
jgi:hypothetical protein